MAFNEDNAIRAFGDELVKEGILHEGDTIGSDRLTLLRFLRARQFDLALAKKQFRECQEWRQAVGIDELYLRIDPFDYPERELIFKNWPMWFHKTDKLGRPINIQIPGGTGSSKGTRASHEKYWETVLVNCESVPRELLPAASRAAGKTIGTAFVIVDLKKFGFDEFWQMKSLLRNTLLISQKYYPDTMGKVVVINAPASFSKIWILMKRWICQNTADKVEVLGKDYGDTLLKFVDAENLPSTLGGRCTCPTDGGCQNSNAGPWLEGRVR